MLEVVNPQSLDPGHVLRRMALRQTGAAVRVCGTNTWRPVEAWSIGNFCFNDLSEVWTNPDVNDWRMPVRHSWDTEEYYTAGYKDLARVTSDHQYRIAAEYLVDKEWTWHDFQPEDLGKLLVCFRPPLDVRQRHLRWLNPQDIQCPKEPRFEGDAVGCGSYRVGSPDSEGLHDCLECGLFFTKEDDQRGVPHP